MSAFPEKSVTNVYGSTLLALRGGGWGSNSQEKMNGLYSTTLVMILEHKVHSRVQAGGMNHGVQSLTGISERKLKGKVLGACLNPTSLYRLETMVVSDRHQQRQIAGAKRADWRKMDDLRGEL